MEELISTEEIAKATKLEKFGGELITNMLMQALKINEVNEFYRNNSHKKPLEFIDSILEKINIEFIVDDNELKNIPVDKAFITVSNHPYGGLDGILLLKILAEKRSDFKVMANFLLSRLEPMSPLLISVNPFGNIKKSSVTGIKQALKHLESGMPLGLFPAGEVSTYQFGAMSVTDKLWNIQAIRLIQKASVPVIPIYFSGYNSVMFQLLGLIHPLLRTATLPKELLNKQNKVVQIRIGKPISVEEQKEFNDINQFSKFLRAKTYTLGTKLEASKFFIPNFARTWEPQPTAIVEKVEVEKVEVEIEKLKTSSLLFEQSDFSVFYAKADEMPNILHEIGRLREETFRSIGEGTNKSIDLDEYDLYYHHLFVWDNVKKCIVGAYRVGKGSDIIQQYGKKGFYLHSLFRIKNEFRPVLKESLELGRSFIVKEYQRKPNSLFLLWKGILYLLLKNKDCRYLIGPVSISNNYSKFSKSLLTDFIKKNYYNQYFASMIKPRNKYVGLKKHKIWKKDLIDVIGCNITKLDDYIKEIENGEGIPVLIKKYLKLNAQIIGFNVDPDFNNCLDGFIVADVFDFPMETVKAFSKEFNDITIFTRFANLNIN